MESHKPEEHLETKKHIAILVSKLIYGGAQLNAVETANAIIGENNVTLYQFGAIGEAVELLNPKVNIVRVRLRLTCFIQFLRDLRRCYEVILIFTPYFCILSYILPKNVKAVYRVVNRLRPPQIYKRSFKEKLIYVLAKKSKGRISKFIVQCESMKDELVKEWQISPKNIYTIYNPIKEKIANYNIQEVRKKYEFIFVGKLEQQKNLEFLILAIQRYFDSGGLGKILIIGRGNYESAISKLCIAYPVEHICETRFVAEYIASSKNILLCSHYEGFPNVLIEALYLNTFIITTPVMHGVSEIVVSDSIGCIVEENVDEFVGAMLNSRNFIHSENQISERNLHKDKFSKAKFKKSVTQVIKNCF